MQAELLPNESLMICTVNKFVLLNLLVNILYNVGKRLTVMQRHGDVDKKQQTYPFAQLNHK